MEQMIDTLVFDFDGVIIDTEVPTYTAWQEVFESFGQSVDRALWSEIIGGGQKLFDTMAYLEKHRWAAARPRGRPQTEERAGG